MVAKDIIGAAATHRTALIAKAPTLKNMDIIHACSLNLGKLFKNAPPSL